jgi:hypothetical protein
MRSGQWHGGMGGRREGGAEFTIALVFFPSAPATWGGGSIRVFDTECDHGVVRRRCGDFSVARVSCCDVDLNICLRGSCYQSDRHDEECVRHDTLFGEVRSRLLTSRAYSTYLCNSF